MGWYCIRYTVYGIWYRICGVRYTVYGFVVYVVWYLVHGTWYVLPGIWYGMVWVLYVLIWVQIYGLGLGAGRAGQHWHDSSFYEMSCDSACVGFHRMLQICRLAGFGRAVCVCVCKVKGG